MLGERRIVIVLRAERFLKPKRSAKTAEMVETEEEAEEAAIEFGPLEDYLASPAPFTAVVFVATGIDRTRFVRNSSKLYPTWQDNPRTAKCKGRPGRSGAARGDCQRRRNR